MSELTLIILRFGFLLLLWMFVMAIVYALRSDLFGSPVSKIRKERGAQRTVRPSSASVVAPSPSLNAAPAAAAGGSSINARTLVITSGPSAGTELVLDANPITIGRSSDSTLVILDEFTSTQHAKLTPTPQGWLLTDLDSTNGTKLNGQRVTDPVMVTLNTPVTIGKTAFELRA